MTMRDDNIRQRSKKAQSDRNLSLPLISKNNNDNDYHSQSKSSDARLRESNRSLIKFDTSTTSITTTSTSTSSNKNGRTVLRYRRKRRWSYRRLFSKRFQLKIQNLISLGSKTKNKPKTKIIIIIIIIIILFAIILALTLVCLLLQLVLPRQLMPGSAFVLRRKSTKHRLKVSIQFINNNNNNSNSNSNNNNNTDIAFNAPFAKPKGIIKAKSPDYGGLNIVFLHEGAHRTIRKNGDDHKGHIYDHYDFGDKNAYDDSVPSYLAFDDDNEITQRFVRTSSIHCRRVSWHRLYNPNCNMVHETPIEDDSTKRLSYGAFRDVFKIHPDPDGPVILKAQRFHDNPFIPERYEFIRIDALIMERLTASPRIADIYSHCSTSILSEYLPGEVEDLVVPTSGYIGRDDDKQEILHDKDDVDPKNDLKPHEKLEMALSMAETIAELHGFKDGVIVHDDIQLAQFLFDKDGNIKLNDFNRGEVMLFDEEHGNYCKYKNGKGGGNYRAPEEYSNNLLNEKIDVWSMGNNIYALLTGLWVFYDDQDDRLMHTKVAHKELAYIDPRYETRSYAEGKLVEIMRLCWIFDPDKRSDIFEIVKLLREAVVENAKLSNQ